MPADPDERPTATDERWDSGVGSRLGDTAPCVAMKYPRYVKATYGFVARPPAGSSSHAARAGRAEWSGALGHEELIPPSVHARLAKSCAAHDMLPGKDPVRRR